MRRLCGSLIVVLGSAACFQPDPAAGAPCGPGDVCPTGLSCVGGLCIRGGDGGNSDECRDEADGIACGNATTSECSAPDTCAADVCANNDRANGTGCYDCAAGAASCATCTQGACPDSMCTPSGTPRPALLTSPLGADNQDEGNMFDVVAAQTITITSFDGHITAGNTDYEIWTRPGTYVGFADSAAGWTKVGMATLTSAGGGAFTAIPIPVNVTILAGQRQAFYLTNKVANNRYHNGTQVGAAVASSPELTIYEGAGVSYATNGFAGTNTPRVWEGKIHYRTGTTLSTPMTGAAKTDGVMFDVTPARDLELSLLAAHLGAGTHDVDVYFRRGSYAGSETNPAQWKKLASIMDVDSDGAARATVVTASLGLFLEAGATTALYVTTTTSADTFTQSVSGPSAAANADLTIGHGVTVTGSFAGVSGNATPNVELGYGTCN